MLKFTIFFVVSIIVGIQLNVEVGSLFFIFARPALATAQESRDSES